MGGLLKSSNELVKHMQSVCKVIGLKMEILDELDLGNGNMQKLMLGFLNHETVKLHEHCKCCLKNLYIQTPAPSCDPESDYLGCQHAHVIEVVFHVHVGILFSAHGGGILFLCKQRSNIWTVDVVPICRFALPKNVIIEQIYPNLFT